ncbi:MAG: ABC-type glycerol-3-phosphate transport system substrate-binding protein, partial [Phenylobacterium sp.]
MKSISLKLLSIGLLSPLAFVFTSSAQSAHPQLKNPFTIAQFTPAKENAEVYDDYRAKWNR